MIIYYHTNPKEPFEVMDDFQKDLLFYSVKNGGSIWVDIKEISEDHDAEYYCNKENLF
jgi:hypothetical protein